MHARHWLRDLCVALWMATCSAALLAGAVQQGATAAVAAASAAVPMPGPGQYSAKGADTCLDCHDDDNDNYRPESLFKTKHGLRGDKRSPFGPKGLQCETCHGPGALHSRDKLTASIISFKPGSKVSVERRSAICSSCHEGASRTGWHAGAHARNQVACSDCHRVHLPQGDPALAKATETRVCLGCHKRQVAEFYKTSAHPVQQGLMSCSGCHDPHGSSAQAMLVKPTLNQTCYGCHADKRGPVLWEHQPVVEDCSLCHAAHGSVRPALLTKSPPLLCQQCHSQAAHPSVARTANGLPGGTAGGTSFVVAGSCTNCHAQVHGSNHPSGANLLR